MAEWRTLSFWVGFVCSVIYVLFLLIVVPWVIYNSVQDGFTKEEQLVLIGGMFVLVSVPISFWLIYQHLIHFNRPNLQKPIVRILWMVPIYALNAWLALLLPNYTIYLDSIRECYEAYVIYNFMVYLLEALCMEMDLHAVMREKPQVRHYFPFCCLRNWDMGQEFVYKCKHGILQYAFFQPIITLISVICELFGVYGKGTISFNYAYPYLVAVTNCSQSVAMYCLVLFYLANRDDLRHMRPFPKFACIKAVIFFSFFQGMVINILVYFKVIKNIFGTNETDDYQILSEKLQNFLLCIEMVVAALAHHYSYPAHEHRINIPNHRRQNDFRQILGSMLDVNDIYQDVREHWGALKNSLTKPFRSADPFQESKGLLDTGDTFKFATGRGRGSGDGGGGAAAAGTSSTAMQFNEMTSSGSGFDAAVAGSSRYGTVNYVGNAAIPQREAKATAAVNYHQGAPPQFSNMFRSQQSAASSSRMDGSVTTTSSSTATLGAAAAAAGQACKKSDSNNTDSWPMSNSVSSDVVNIEVKGPEENLIQLPDSPQL